MKLEIRKQRIEKLRKQGKTYEEIGLVYNISQERVRQILTYTVEYCDKHQRKYIGNCLYCQTENDYVNKVHKILTSNLANEIERLKEPSRKKEIVMQRSALIQALKNKYNLSFIQYHWSQRYNYNNTANYNEYPLLWSLVSEPALDNTIYIGNSVVSNFTRYAPALGTVYVTTNDNSELVQVCTYESGGKLSCIITNTVNDQQNGTFNCGSFTGNLIDISSGSLYSCASGSVNLGVLNAYDVKYYTEPTNDGTYTIASLTDTVITTVEALNSESALSTSIYGTTLVTDIDLYYDLIENSQQKNDFISATDKGTLQKYSATGLDASVTTPIGMTIGTESYGWVLDYVFTLERCPLRLFLMAV